MAVTTDGIRSIPGASSAAGACGSVGAANLAMEPAKQQERSRLGRTGVGHLLVLYLGFIAIGLGGFLGAGRWDWSAGWLWVIAEGVFAVTLGLVLVFLNPELLNERGKRHEGGKPFDKAVMAVFALLEPTLPAVAGLDAVRFGPSSMPDFLRWPGVALLVVSGAFVLWAMVVNRHAETGVRIQEDRGHQVVTTGPYRIVRHPMYLGLIVHFVSWPLVLGSWWGMAMAVGLLVLFAVRTALEDRVLRAELAGYEEYAARTRYRLVPLVW